VLGACLTATILLEPSARGLPAEARPGEEVYAFEHLAVTRDFLELHVYSGYLVPACSGGEVVGAVVLGRGEYEFKPPQNVQGIAERDIGRPTVSDSLDAVYLPGTYSYVESLRYESDAAPVSAPGALAKAQRVLEEKPLALRIPLPFGLARLETIEGDPFYTRISGDQLGVVEYVEAADVSLTFVTLGGKRIAFTNPDAGSCEARLPSSSIGGTLPLATFLFWTGYLLLFALAVVLTADLPHSTLRTPLTESKSDLALAAAFVLLETALWVFVDRLALDPRWVCGPYGAMGALGVWFVLWRGHGASGLGLTWGRMPRAILVGALVGVTGTIIVSLGYPRELAVTDTAGVLQKLGWSFLAAGLVRSLYQQGFIQGTLQRVIGGVPALFTTAVLASGTQLVARLVASPGIAAPMLVDVAVTVPAGALLAGFLYMRTNNLASSVVARTLLDVLPKIFVF